MSKPAKTISNCLCIAAALCLLVAAPGHARAWRIGLGGGRTTGLIGTLALNGIHRECLTDRQLRDPAVLAEYDLMIVSTGAGSPAEVSRAIAKYVEAGGVAITEVRVMPSTAVVPGQRLGPAAGPNLRFTGYDHPISAPMRGAGVVAVQASLAAAIIPAEGAKVTVLAEFTDEGVNKKYAGKLTGGRKHVPAMLLFDHGKGRWLYSGVSVSYSLALRGPTLQPWLVAALDHLTDGEVVPRLKTLPTASRLLPQVQWAPEPDLPVPHRPGGDATASDLPEGFEALDVPADGNADFLLTGELMTREQAEVLLSWYNADWYRTIKFDGDKIRAVEVSNGRERVVHEVPRPPFSKSLVPLTVRRHPGFITLSLDDAPVLMAAMDSVQGEVAVSGILDAYCQSTAPVYFDDDFMRAEGEAGPWETPAGKWELYKVEGDATLGANPFAFAATADTFASAIAGHGFWDDYDLACSVRSSADAVGLYANYQAPDNCLVLRLTYPRTDEPASVSVSRLTPDGTRTLARAPVDATRESWHRLRLQVSGGRVAVRLDGREVLTVTDALARGHGQVGLFAELGSALFDDVNVRPWRALAQPGAADGPWAWEVEGGSSSAAHGALVLNSRSTMRALAPVGDYLDVGVSAQVLLGKAQSAGVLLRYRGPRHHYRVALARQDRAMALQVVRVEEGAETVLAQAPVNVRTKGWASLEGRARGRTIEGWLNGERIVSVSDCAFEFGRVGLHCAGKGSVAFRNAEVRPLESIWVTADPPTPPFAGIIDQHTWAGRGSGWVPVPDDLDLFWHRGLYPDQIEARIGVHRLPDGRASVSVALGDGTTLESGYALVADQPNAGQPVALTLMRRGESVATVEMPAAPAEGYALVLERADDLLIARVGEDIALTWRDPDPIADAKRVGFRRDAATIDAADVDVLSPEVRTHIFKTAPVEWQNLSGTWEISNRWSCSPNWKWLAGWNQTGEARTLTRESYVGDIQVDLFIAAKMMPKPNGAKGHYEELRDLHAGLCEDGQGGGYKVVLGADAGARSYIERDGKVVATTSWVVPQGERHNNWLMVTLVKRGATVSVLVWDNEVLRYEDPEPLDGGRVALGTQHNGVIIPRITIYGEPAPQ